MSENEKDEESYENFEPPLHSTAIYADEAELSKHSRSFIPSTPQGKEAKRRKLRKRKYLKAKGRNQDVMTQTQILPTVYVFGV